jgi:hypothetical protein
MAPAGSRRKAGNFQKHNLTGQMPVVLFTGTTLGTAAD